MELIEFLNEGVYCIYNNVTGHLYIGSTINLGSRKDKHFSLLKHNRHQNHRLQKDYNNYGKENFSFYILKYCTENLLIEEQSFIKKLNPEYNLITEVVKKKMSEESKAKMSATRLRLYKEGKLKPNCAVSIIQTDLDGNFIQNFDSIRAASIKLNIDKSAIQKVLRGVHKQMKGYKFLYNN